MIRLAPLAKPALFLLAVLLAWASYSFTAKKAHEIKWALCFKENVEVCTDLIDSGHETTQDLTTDFNNRGNGYISKGDYDRAIRDFNAAIQQDPKDYHAYSNRGAAHSKNAEYDDALKDFNAALQLAPADAVALNNIATLYAFRHEYIKAIQSYDKAIALQPNSAGSYCSRSALKLKMGNTLGAEDDATKARSLGETADCVMH